ncbi:hypothetical protein KK421_03280 [Clostridioides difficile]|nr:hypothetical protein [Clostridioides difficile]
MQAKSAARAIAEAKNEFFTKKNKNRYKLSTDFFSIKITYEEVLKEL